MKKQYYLTLIILFITISCKSQEYDDSITFRPENYSYNKGYDIIPHETSGVNFHIGEEYMVMYSMKDYNCLLAPLKVKSIENKEVFYTESTLPFPVFDISHLKVKYERQYIDTEEYIFLFKGLEDKRERVAKEIMPTEATEDMVIFEYMGEKYKLIQKVGKKIAGKEEEDEILQNVTYSIQTSSCKQNLLYMDEITYTTSVLLHYIGDIDNDSKPDLVFRITIRTEDDISKNYFMMFLSSEAENGKIVKHVATRLYEYKMLEIIDDSDLID